MRTDSRAVAKEFRFDDRRVVVSLPASIVECGDGCAVVDVEGLHAVDALRSPELRRAVRRAVGDMIAELAGHRARVAIQFDRPERVEPVGERLQ